MPEFDPLFSLSGKTALVTGGTSGIGTMIARGLLARGVKTYVSGRDQTRTAEFAEELSGDGGSCIGLAADLAAADGAEKLAAQMAEREDRLDILVNNAGVGSAGSLAQTTGENWDLVLDVNLRAPFFLTRDLLPLLKAAASAEDPARIINIGSIGGLHVPAWEAHNYGASKAGLHHLTRSLAKTLGKENITVNAIAPGPFPSRMNDVQSDAMKASIAANIPLNRPGSAEDVQGAVAFLASRAGAYVSGHTIPLDGGYIGAL